MKRQLFVILGSLFLGGLLAFLPNSLAFAHGFGERYDLPLPLWLYIVGAASAVVLSFGVVSLFINNSNLVHDYPRINILRWAIGRVLVHRMVLIPIKIFSILLLLLVIFGGQLGNQGSTENFAPTLVWVIWWVGLAYFSALIGNVWTVINPWKASFEVMEYLYRKCSSKQQLSFNKQFPKRLGVWPGLALFAGFAWIELVYPNTDVPSKISLMALIYSIITWLGMFCFGRERWLRQGEAFAIVFGFLGMFSPTEIRVLNSESCRQCAVDCMDLDGLCIDCSDCFNVTASVERELNLRPYGVGLLRNLKISTSNMLFVILLLCTVTFDGFLATPAWSNLANSLMNVFSDWTTVTTMALFGFPCVFLGIYLIVIKLMTFFVDDEMSLLDIASSFVYSLIPIALAYHIAHFLGFLLIQGQLAIPLMSDPLGLNWNLIGSADYIVNIGIINAKFTWVIAVVSIVIGHIVSVFLAHVTASRIIVNRRFALYSQYPMLVFMVGYTMISLWILAQPIVEFTG